MTLVLNATPLIYLARAGGLGILKGLRTSLYIPRAVYEEVVIQGRKNAKPGAGLVDQYVTERVITVRNVADARMISSLVPAEGMKSPLHRGEAEVIVLARELDCPAIIDEQAGRNVARLHGIEVHGTVYLLALAFKAGNLSRDEMLRLFKAMVAEGWRISLEDYNAIMEELEKL